MFAKYGVIRVSELAEIVAVAKAYLAPNDYRRGGAGIISSSGGQAGAAADLASVPGVAVPTPERGQSAQAIDGLLAFGTGFNPCDLTGEIAVKPELAAQVYDQFATNESIGAVVYIRKKLLGDVSQRCAGPAGRGGQPRRGADPARLRHGRVHGRRRGADLPRGRHPVVHVADRAVHRDAAARRARPPSFDRLERPRAGDRNRRRLDRSSTSRPPATSSTRRPPKPRCTTTASRCRTRSCVSTVDDAVKAATRIGYPVVIKVADPEIAHKTEIGGVIIGVRRRERRPGRRRRGALARGTEALGGRAPQGILVQEQVVGGVEMIVGLKVDPDLGAVRAAG